MNTASTNVADRLTPSQMSSPRAMTVPATPGDLAGVRRRGRQADRQHEDRDGNGAGRQLALDEERQRDAGDRQHRSGAPAPVVHPRAHSCAVGESGITPGSHTPQCYDLSDGRMAAALKSRHER
jgi:hypothetical protein